MPFPILHRGGKVLTLGAVENDVNLASKFGTPSESLNVLFFNTANKAASTAATPGMRTGLTWKPGSSVFLRNSATIAGASGIAGTPGTTGTQGAGGAGGRGGQYGPPAPNNGSGSPGSAGGTGGAGGIGGTGGAGGPSFTADTVSGVRIVVDNGSGTLTGGNGGAAGPGGPGGPGGGGGGGGGAAGG
jgi:hypothetical protein